MREGKKEVAWICMQKYNSANHGDTDTIVEGVERLEK